MMRSLRGRCATGLGTRLLLLLGESLLLLSEPVTRACFLWTLMHLPKMEIAQERLIVKEKLKRLLKKNAASLLFQVIDMQNGPRPPCSDVKTSVYIQSTCCCVLE